jgi:hypothetical protein
LRPSGHVLKTAESDYTRGGVKEKALLKCGMKTGFLVNHFIVPYNYQKFETESETL